jgi:hypothetical protein
LAIAKLGMSDDDAKKLKKNDLIKRLSQWFSPVLVY